MRFLTRDPQFATDSWVQGYGTADFFTTDLWGQIMKNRTIELVHLDSAEDRPPVGVYPTGHAGWARAWDGQAWVGAGVAITGDSRQYAHSRWWRRSPFWCAFAGLILGITLTSYGVHVGLIAVVAVGALLGSAGPALAVLFTIHDRLGLRSLRLGAATWWGLAAGVLAVLVGVLLELVLRDPIFAGPVEETAKLVLPFLLLAAGVRGAQNPRIGIWMVAASSATFGVLEGVEYVVVPHLSGAGTPLDQAIFASFPLLVRASIELLHLFLTTGAAAVIWLAAHNHKKAFTWAGLGAFLLASAVHSFNDAVLARVGGFVSLGLGIALLVASYVLWFRPRIRGAVPPDAVDDVPKRWLPPVKNTAPRRSGTLTTQTG